jgi:hypothetical protein
MRSSGSDKRQSTEHDKHPDDGTQRADECRRKKGPLHEIVGKKLNHFVI